MRIAILGANSPIGRKVVLKAEEHGISTVLCVPSFTDIIGNGRIVIKNYSELSFNDLKDCHYVIDTESFFNISKYSSEDLPLWHLIETLKDTDTKVLAFGSSAFLYSGDDRRKMVIDTEDVILDDIQNKIDRLCVNAYKRLCQCSNVKWSVLCPPLLLDMHAYGSGKIEFSNDVLPVGLNGDSYISISDFVTASVELLKLGPKPFKCVSVRAKKS